MLSASKMLNDDGTFVAKFFKMSDLSYLQVMMKQMFRDVYVVKPESSRGTSAEAFVVGLGFSSSGKLAILSESLSALKEEVKQEEEVKEVPAEDKDSDDDDKLTF